MILEIVAKSFLIIAYSLVMSVIGFGVYAGAIGIMSQTESRTAHWIIALMGVTPIGIILWTIQDTIEWIIQL